MYVPYPSKMKKKPEDKESTPPHIERPDYREMTELEAEGDRRARFLMSPFNVKEAHRNKSRMKFIYYLLLAIAMVITIIWAVTR